jgi:hypothetical protein
MELAANGCFLPRRRRWSNAKLPLWLGKSFAPILLSASCSRIPDKLGAGYFLCRSSISIEKLLKPLPVTVLEETESSSFALSRGKRTRKDDAGGSLGRAEEEECSPLVGASEVEGGAAELDH